MRGQRMGAAELAAVVRRRFPGVDPSLESDLVACEEAAANEATTAREALRLVQVLARHEGELKFASKPAERGSKMGARAEDILSKPQERAS